METTACDLGWSEDQFWSCSLSWLRSAMAGLRKRSSAGDTRDEDTLREEYEQSKIEHAAALSRTDEDLRLLREEREARKVD